MRTFKRCRHFARRQWDAELDGTWNFSVPCYSLYSGQSSPENYVCSVHSEGKFGKTIVGSKTHLNLTCLISVPDLLTSEIFGALRIHNAWNQLFIFKCETNHLVFFRGWFLHLENSPTRRNTWGVGNRLIARYVTFLGFHFYVDYMWVPTELVSTYLYKRKYSWNPQKSLLIRLMPHWKISAKATPVLCLNCTHIPFTNMCFTLKHGYPWFGNPDLVLSQFPHSVGQMNGRNAFRDILLCYTIRMPFLNAFTLKCTMKRIKPQIWDYQNL